MAGGAQPGRLRRLFLTTFLVCLFLAGTTEERQPLAQEVPPEKPNILFILTDDQDPESLARMANVKSQLVDQGTNFTRAFATTSVCCPSRVSYMRGQYVHNHGVLSNVATSEGGYERFREVELQHSTVATWLDDAGYATFYAGKFLNGYKKNTYVPPGWDRWFAFGGGVGQDYTVNENGSLRNYTQEQKHETYYLRDRAEAFIRNRAQGAPWFAMVSTHAPHGPHTTAPEFVNSYDGAPMPQPPSYNEADVSDKPAFIQALPLVDEDCSTDEYKLDCHEQVEEEWRARQETLMSVDVMVKDLLGTLDETNQMDRTYVVFASDNGYLLYRHRWYSKGVPYEESQGIPFVVRGPNVRQGAVSEELVANIDVAPTIADWAGVEPPGYVDGRSLVPLLEGTYPSWRQRLLFEYYRAHPYFGARTAGGETYAEYATGEKEYYDLDTDPWQLESAHAAPENAGRLGALSEAIAGLKGCSGEGCRVADLDCSADQSDNDGDGTVDEPGEPCGDPRRPPDTGIITGPDDLTSSTSATFSFYSSKGGSTFECSLDGSDFAPCSPENNTLHSKTYENLSAAGHTFSVRATDRAGDTDPTPASHTWAVDTTKPTSTSVKPAEGAKDVSPRSNVQAYFSEAMNRDKITNATFKLVTRSADGTITRVKAQVAYNATLNRAVLKPTNDLRPGTTYIATVTTMAEDLAGNRFDQNQDLSGNQSKTWRFTVR